MILYTRELKKKYNKLNVFSGFSFHFQPNEKYAIVGKNGSGKSTLLRILANLDRPTSGDIRYEYKQMEIKKEHVYKYISFSAPYVEIIDDFTLHEMLRFHFSFKPSPYSIDDIIDMNHWGAAILNTTVKEFSSGMKQKLKLSLSLFSDAQIFFFDEPHSNLDEESKNWFNETLENISKEKMAIIASNDKREIPPHSVMINIEQYK